MNRAQLSALRDPTTRDATLAALAKESQRREAPLTAVKRDAGQRRAFRISTNDVDRYDSTIDPKGWRLERYMRNPVVLWMHDTREPPVARSLSVEADDTGLIAEPEFVDRKVYPFAGTVSDMLEAGFLNAASVSWQPLKWVFNEERAGVDFLEQELLEWSVVTVPGNADALLERAAAEGIDLDPLREVAERVLKRTGVRDEAALGKPALYVLHHGDVTIRTTSARRLSRAAAALGLLAAPAVLKRAEEPDAAEEPVPEEPAAAAADACKCGREYGADDKFCAACGEKRAEPAPVEDEKSDDDIDAERVLAAIQRIAS